MTNGEMVTIYTPGDTIIVLDMLGRAYVYGVENHGALVLISAPIPSANGGKG